MGLRPPISEDYRSSGEKLTCSSDSSSSRPRVNNTDVIMTQQSPSCATLLTSPVESSYMDEEDEESGEKNEVEEVQEEEQPAKKRSRSGRISRRLQLRSSVCCSWVSLASLTSVASLLKNDLNDTIIDNGRLHHWM